MEKYFTKDKFKEYTGIDLGLELDGIDDESGKITRFIRKITDWCKMYLIKHYSGQDLDSWDSLAEWRQEIFVKGCMEQAAYVLRNGFVRLDSGYKSDLGVVIDLSKIAMSQDALDIFWDGCFANIEQKAIVQYPWED